jgi:hypothetical protein
MTTVDRTSSAPRGRGALALLATGVLLAGCGAATTPKALQPATSVPAASTSTTTRNDVTVKVVLDRTQVRGGSAIAGTVTVTNTTGHRIAEPLGCRETALAVALSRGKLTTAWAWTAQGCNPAFAFLPGVTRLPVSVTTVHDTTDGLRPLPTGRYQAKLYLNQYPLPTPPPITVAIT